MFTKLQLRKAFSSRVFEGRNQSGLSQLQLAESMSTSVRWIQRIESGAKLPGFYLAVQLILFLQINIEEMLYELSGGTAVAERNRETVLR